MRESLRWCLPVVISVASLSVGQEVRILPAPVAPGGGDINDDAMRGKESAQGVYVRDSAIALEKFALAQRMQDLKEWAKAADLYQEVLEKFADRVVPSQVDKDNNIYQYISVIAAVQQKMSKWPPEGLEVYRQRYEAAAQSIMEGAKVDDRTAMQTVLNRYFPTETAKAAGIRLMDLYLESGEFAAAAWMGEQLLSGHPNLIVERPKVLYRCALAYHLAGDVERSRAKVAELTDKYPEETGTVRGEDVRLSESIVAELSQNVAPSQTLADSAWPQFGGSNDHARISTAAGKPGAKLYSVELTKPNVNNVPAGNRDGLRQLQDAYERDERTGATLGVFPVIDRGEMFFQDGVKLYGLSVEGGHPLPGWADRKGVYQIPGAARYPARGQFLPVTLTDNSVLAIMGQSDRRAAQFGLPAGAQGDARVVCLDRATGKERWIIQPRNLPDDAQALRNCEFNGAPLVVENNVYVAARSARAQNQGNPFEDCYLLCFDAETGKYKWNCYIASANNFTSPYGWDGDLGSNNAVAQLAYSSGRLYVLTNLGALAAVDAYGGRIVWLSIYPRDPQLNQMAGRRVFMGNVPPHLQKTDKPWQANPVIIDSGRVFILPSDGRFIHAYDAGSGIELKRLDVKHFDSATSLIAVMGPNLVLTGGKTLTTVNWEKYDIDNFPVRNGPGGGTDPNLVRPKVLPAEIRGRAFVAGNSAYVSTETNLYVIDLVKAKVTQIYPNPKTWDREKNDGEGPGNILVSDDHVIIAANRRIDVYTDMEAAKRKLDAKIAANEKSPDPRLEYAEVMFVAGDIPAALAKLDEAIELLGGRANMQTGPSRDRLFNHCMNFAQRLARHIKSKDHENLEAVEALYDRAALAAATPLQQVTYRMQRAHLENTIADYADAVRLYQQIIADPHLRAVPIMDEQTSVQSAGGALARRLIDGILRARGNGPYAELEKEAQAALEKARAAGSADELVGVATRYPNAKVAPQALVAAADLRDEGNDPRGAVQLLRQAYLSYPNFTEKRHVLESLARNYLKLPNRTEVAIARLAEAARLAGDEKLAKPLVLPDGRQLSDITLSQAAEELKKVRTQEAARNLPDFGLPVPPTYVNEKGIKVRREPLLPHTQDQIIPDVTALLSPSREATRYDRVAYYARGAVHIAAVGENKPLISIPMPEQPAGMTWTPTGPLIWTTRSATLLKGDTDEVAWAFETKALGAVEAVAAVPMNGDNTDTDQPPANLSDEDLVMINNGVLQQQIMINRQRINRRLVIVNGQHRELPANVQADKPVAGGNESIISARVVGDFVLFNTTSGRIVAVELADGRIRWQTRLADRLPNQIVADEDFTILFQREDSSATITALDSFTGQVVGRRVFGAETGQMPTNIALSPDGTLVYLLPQRIVLKNLYEAWSSPDRDIKTNQSNNLAFVSTVYAEQLQVVDGKIYVITDAGMNLRGYSMETLKPLRYSVDGKPAQDLVLSTTARNNEEVKLKIVGQMAYLVGPRTLKAYNLESPDKSWSPWTSDSTSHETIADTFIGKNHLVMLKDTKKRVGNHVMSYRLQAQARYPISEDDPAEVGRNDYWPIITDPAGIKTVQAVEGGFYYLTADQKLHFVKANSKPDER